MPEQIETFAVSNRCSFFDGDRKKARRRFRQTYRPPKSGRPLKKAEFPARSPFCQAGPRVRQGNNRLRNTHCVRKRQLFPSHKYFFLTLPRPRIKSSLISPETPHLKVFCGFSCENALRPAGKRKWEHQPKAAKNLTRPFNNAILKGRITAAGGILTAIKK